ncbi:MAG TPA: hypothetical protein VGL38_08525 [bacterium]|jgi:hypothetical protein
MLMWLSRWNAPLGLLALGGLAVWRAMKRGGVSWGTSRIMEPPMLTEGRRTTALITIALVLLAVLGLAFCIAVRHNFFRAFWIGMQNGAFEK